MASGIFTSILSSLSSWLPLPSVLKSFQTQAADIIRSPAPLHEITKIPINTTTTTTATTSKPLNPFQDEFPVPTKTQTPHKIEKTETHYSTTPNLSNLEQFMKEMTSNPVSPPPRPQPVNNIFTTPITPEPLIIEQNKKRKRSIDEEDVKQFIEEIYSTDRSKLKKTRTNSSPPYPQPTNNIFTTPITPEPHFSPIHSVNYHPPSTSVPRKKNKKFTIRKTKLNTGQKRRREYEDNSFQPTKHQRIEGNRFKMIFSEDTIEFPMNLSPHTVGGGVVSKRKRVSDACEIVNTELEEVRPKAKKQKIQCNEEETVDEIIKRGRKRSHYPLNKKLQAEFRRLSQEQREEIYQKEEIKKNDGRI